MGGCGHGFIIVKKRASVMANGSALFTPAASHCFDGGASRMTWPV